MDGFPAWVGSAAPPPAGVKGKALVMGYNDGNTTTALWNYAQYFALNDNNFTTQFGPSTPGAINLISGQTNGFSATKNVLDGSGALLHGTHEAFGDAAHLASNLTEIGDGDPLGDICSNPAIDQITMAGKNIGDLLDDEGITWGAFMGGFDLTVVNPNGTTNCRRQTNPTAPGTPAFTSVDYIPHHPCQRIQPGGSFDTIAGSLHNMFDLEHPFEEQRRRLILNETTGAMVSVSHDRDDYDRDDRR